MGTRPSADPALQRYNYKYRNDAQVYIRDRVLPPVTVTTRQGHWYKRKGGHGYSVDLSDLKRASGEKYKRIVRTVERESGWFLEDYGIESAIDATDAEFAKEEGLSLREDAAEDALDEFWMALEKAVADLVMTPANWGGNTSAILLAARWNNGGDPRTPIDAAAAAIRLVTGISKRRLSLVIPEEVAEALRRNSVLAAVVQYTSVKALYMPLALVVEALGIKEIIVGEAVYNTLEDSPAHSETNASIWTSDKALLAWIEPNPKPGKPHGIGATFRRKGIPATGKMIRYNTDAPPAEIVGVKTLEDIILTNTESGWLFDTVIS
jgi:hypothetical protein